MGWCTLSNMVFPLVLSRRALNQSMQALDCRVITSLLLAHKKAPGSIRPPVLLCSAIWVHCTRAPSPDQASRCSTICVDVGVRCTPKSTGIDQASSALVQCAKVALHKSTFTDQASRCSFVYIFNCDGILT